jgi:DNA-3-methyladenine glycosylase
MKPQIFDKGHFKNIPLKTDGPGKLTKAFLIDRGLNRLPLEKNTGLWVEESGIVPGRIVQTPRIGVDYAEEWKDKPWRFLIEKL